MSELVLELDSIESTQLVAYKMASKLSIGMVVAMTGDLGTGKTTFTQGFAKGLGIKERVSSPTFKIVSEYVGTNIKLYHIDCYRLKNENEFLMIGGENYLDPTDGITIIEWSEKILKIIPEDSIRLHFKRVMDSDQMRMLIINGLKF